MRLGKALSVLLLAAICALCSCVGRRDAPAPAPAEPDREHSQGAPLQSSPPVTEQRLGEPARQPAVPHARAVPAQADSGYIVLQPGETLSYISALYAVSERDLIAWNGLNSAHDVQAGQRLAIRPPNMRGAPPPQAGRAAQPAQAEPAPGGVIVVAPGESLSAIALRHGVTVTQLRAWHGLTSDAIRTGQHLRVQPPHAQASASLDAPDAPDADGMITVQPGQSLSGIAARHKVSKEDLRKWNKLKSDQIKSGQQLRVKAPVRVHTVRAGESLGGIAAKYKVSAKALMQKNKLANADVLPAGKELIIP
jgi:LysM repeat protein